MSTNGYACKLLFYVSCNFYSMQNVDCLGYVLFVNLSTVDWQEIFNRLQPFDNYAVFSA